MLNIDVFKLSSEIKIDTNKCIKDLDAVDSKTKKVKSSLDKTEKSSYSLGTAFMKIADKSKGAMSKIDSVVSKLVKTTSVVATGFVAMGIKANASLQSSTASWETLLGTTDKAKKMLEDITKYAATTPFSKAGVDTMAKQLHNAGFEGEKLFEQLTKFGNMGSAFGVQEDSLKEMVRQYSQVQMATVAYTEDLNILQDRGIPIYKALSETLNVSVADVKKMASEGQITAAVYNEALNSIAEGTQGAMDKQSKTLSGMWSTIKDNFVSISQTVLQPIAEKITEIGPKIIEVIDKVNVGLTDGQPLFESIKNAVIDVFGGEAWQKVEMFKNSIIALMTVYLVLKTIFMAAEFITVVSTAFTTLKGIIMGTTIAQNGLNLAFLSNPITWLIMLISGLVAAFIHLWNTSEGFRNFWIGAWEAIKTKLYDAASFIKNKFDWVCNSISAAFTNASNWINNKIEWIKSLLRGEWSLPKIKLPHFNVTGKFSLSPPSIPKFSVAWYSDGAIFKNRTILPNGIGVGDKNKGFGDNPEAIIPLDKLWDKLDRIANRPINISIDGRECMIALSPYQNELYNYSVGRV